MNVKPTDENLTAIQTGELKLVIKKQKFPPALPWNGTVTLADGSLVQMTNTCTVDNGLFIIHTLLSARDDIADSFKLSNNPIYKLLYNIHKQFTEKNYAKGKLMFLDGPVMDAYGAEDTYFFVKFRIPTVFESKCSNEHCPEP